MHSSAIKKLIQVSEEVQKPVHVPIVLGNEWFIITQQDVRKIEDARFISYHKLGPNGELVPIETVLGQEVALRDAIAIAGGFQNLQQTLNEQLIEMLGKCCGKKQQFENPIKASIAQQMEWANSCNNTSPPFPFTYSTSTSISDIQHPQNKNCCCKKSHCCACPSKFITDQGCNTVENDPSTENIECTLSARQMLKIRKSIEDIMGI